LPLTCHQVNPKAAESLADPEEYSNLFEDWQVALSVEANTAETRYPSTYFLLFAFFFHGRYGFRTVVQ